ncbi:glycine-rich domain-containing protein-like, partial [Escherichia coli]|uniref:glycine-rich domain-containing protein-like n=1 Tax=Escherichia coli TaxID=562 RepID=UPI002000833D
ELYGKILDNSNVISTTIIESCCLKETEKVWNELYPQEPFSFNYFNLQEDDVPKDQLSQLEKYTKYDLVSAVKRQTP